MALSPYEGGLEPSTSPEIINTGSANLVTGKDVSKVTGQFPGIVIHITDERIGAAGTPLVHEDQVVVAPNGPKNPSVGQFNQLCGWGSRSAVQREDGVRLWGVTQRLQYHDLEFDGASGFCRSVLKHFIGSAKGVALKAWQLARLK
jgi:hypothetical protein